MFKQIATKTADNNPHAIVFGCWAGVGPLFRWSGLQESSGIIWMVRQIVGCSGAVRWHAKNAPKKKCKNLPTLAHPSPILLERLDNARFPTRLRAGNDDVRTARHCILLMGERKGGPMYRAPWHPVLVHDPANGTIQMPKSRDRCRVMRRTMPFFFIGKMSWPA